MNRKMRRATWERWPAARPSRRSSSRSVRRSPGSWDRIAAPGSIRPSTVI